MDYKSITNKNSKQWQLQKMAYTDSEGLRKINNRYLIAVGSYFTRDVGTEVDVYLNDGSTLPCIVGDAKDDRHTINGHSTGTHNDAIEFIVEQSKLHSIAKKRGDCSFIPGLGAAVTAIEVERPLAPEEEEIAETLQALVEMPEEVSEVPAEEQEYVSIEVSTEEPIVMNILDELSDVQP